MNLLKIVRTHDIYNKRWNKITERMAFSYENITNYIKQAKHTNDKTKAA